MAQQPSTASRDRVRNTVPKLIDLSERCCSATCGNARSFPSATAA